MSDMLIIRLKGPLQSWGTTRRNEWRRSTLAPTKSAVVGLLAACLGRQRGDDMSDLAGLAMVTRVDAPGVMGVDFQMFHAGSHAQMSHRENLEDAAFVVGLIGNPSLISQCSAALKNPVYEPFLGRKANVPSLPIFSRVCQDVSTYEEALDYIGQEPWIGFGQEGKALITCRIMFDTAYSPREGVAIDAAMDSRPDTKITVPNPYYKDEQYWSPLDAL